MDGFISGKKDSIFVKFKQLGSLNRRIAESMFVIEDELLVERAFVDGLCVETLLYSKTTPEILQAAKRAGVARYLISEGLMGAVTTTRPLPSVMATVRGNLRDLHDYPEDAGALLVTDGVANPDNLGMILRTADALGDALAGCLILGEGAHPFHKNCIRAARGALGRVPLFHPGRTENDADALRIIKTKNVRIVGTDSNHTNAVVSMFDLPYSPRIAFLLGNENFGVRPELLALCDATAHIPMAAGRDSLNVGVAAGVLLYDWLRQNATATF